MNAVISYEKDIRRGDFGIEEMRRCFCVYWFVVENNQFCMLAGQLVKVNLIRFDEKFKSSGNV